MPPNWTRLLILPLVLGCLASPALAVMLDDPPSVPADEDFAAGTEAFEREDWARVIEHMSKVIARRPWHDEAHNRLGFAHRKLGDYDRSLEHYHRALQLNPHNRGALEYLGEAYLELGQEGRAREVLHLLETECQRVADGGSWQDECEEWQDLVAAFEAHGSKRAEGPPARE